MEKKIEKYIETVFRDVPKNERSENIRREILQNLLDKYHDLVAEGKGEEEAYALAISTGGDLSGIVADLRGENVPYNYNYEKQFDKLYEKEYKKEKKKCERISSLLWPVAVCIFVVIGFAFKRFELSWIVFILAAAVDNLIRFLVIKSNPKVRKNSRDGFIWMLGVTVYFVFSFVFHSWAYSWVIFVITFLAQRIVALVCDAEKEEDEKSEK